MNSKLNTEEVRSFMDAVLTLRTREECFDFFEDVCTINELLAIAQRLEVAKRLREGDTYLEICDKTGASTATISRVNRSLNFGNNGYDIALDRLAGKDVPTRGGETGEN